jgi:N-acetylmuramoyl-L-alanine amidase
MPKVFLTAGHGGTDPGAKANNLIEKVINLNVLLECKKVLEDHGVTVLCSRLRDENDSVYDEVKEANASGADLAFSIHTNAGGGDGFEAFYYDTNANGKKLAALAEKHVKTIGQNSRGLKSGNHLYFVRNTSMMAVLVENFFLQVSWNLELVRSDEHKLYVRELYHSMDERVYGTAEL